MIFIIFQALQFILGPLQGELQGHLTLWNAAIQTNQLNRLKIN